MNYGLAIESLRRDRGLSRYALAEASGVSASYLSEVERGLKRPTADVLAKIGRAFGMQPSELLQIVETVSLPPSATELPRSAVRSPALAEPAEVAPGGPAVVAPADRRDALLKAFVNLAPGLSAEDLQLLVDLARRLAHPRR